MPHGFNLYIDGHLHKNYEIEKGNKKLIIPGSTVLTQLRKEEKIKGFYIFDTNTKEKNFIEIPTRKFYYLEIENEKEKEDLISQKQNIINKMNTIDYNSKPIVRLDFVSNSDSNLISHIKELYSDKCYLYINSSKEEDEKDLIEGLEKEFEGEETVKERGMKILKETLLKNNYKGKEAEEMFDFLCDCDEQELYEKFIEVVK